MQDDGSKLLEQVLIHQFGAAIETLRLVIEACPDDLWADQDTLFWYWASHTIFWLDYYLEPVPEDYKVPAPFDMCEMDPAGVLPPRVYTKEELLAFLVHARGRMVTAISGITPERSAATRKHGKRELSTLEMHLYNMRHVQHHAAQLNMILRKRTNNAAPWVGSWKG